MLPMRTVLKMVYIILQLGNWSRRLNELFNLDEHELPEDGMEQNDDDERHDASIKFFHLLNTLSDLMMLPKDMLVEKSVRKEVIVRYLIPTFSLKQKLDNHRS